MTNDHYPFPARFLAHRGSSEEKGLWRMVQSEERSSLPAVIGHEPYARVPNEMCLTSHAQSSGQAPTSRHRAVTSADRPRHLIFFTTNVSERSRSISYSFSEISDQGRTGTLLERELPLHLVMNGVR
jgi:hypothetical protein